MDERTEELRRRHEASPADVEAARAYEAALLRAGRHDAVRALYRLKFACPVSWSTMEPTFDPKVRRCDQCARSVHAVATPGEFLSMAARGECVAFHPGQLEAAVEAMIADPTRHPAQEPGRPCLLELSPGEAAALGPEPAPHMVMLAGAPLPFTPPGVQPPVSDRPPGPVSRLFRRLRGE